MSDSGNSLIRALKQSVADRLLGQAYFASIPVLVKIDKDILNSIQQGTLPLQSQVAVFIGGLSMRNPNPNTPGPYFDDARLMIDVLENPSFNTGLPNCDEIAETIMRLLHPFTPLNGNEASYITDFSEAEDETYNMRRIYLHLPVGFQRISIPPIAAVVATPSTPAQGDQTVTLTCATLGAPIWFTTDGTTPSPLNPSSQMYIPSLPGLLLAQSGFILETEDGPTIQPLVISPGTKLRARAWLAGYAASNPSETNLQY